MSPASQASSDASQPELAKAAAAKPWLTVQAEILLAGHHAVLIDDDHGQPMLVVSKWAMCRSFHTAADARAWLQLVTGKPA